jgi:hypothetical protein
MMSKHAFATAAQGRPHLPVKTRPPPMRATRLFLLALPLALSLPAALAAQDDDSEEWVRNCRRWNQERENHCEVRETRLPARGTLRVDGHENGGVSVKAWNGEGVVVRARIQASARSMDQARRIAQDIRVRTGGETIEAEGPDRSRGESWSVSYEILVPRRTGLEVRTSNGPISVEGVSGEMDLRAHNGPLALRGVSGNVEARTDNGPLSVTLDGDRWSGEGLDAETTNGPITLMVPQGYSAELTTGTVNGPMNVDIPITVQGRFPRRFTTTLGRGGPPIRVVTTNGPVNVRRR